MFKYNVEALRSGQVIKSERGLLDFGSAASLAEVVWPRDGVAIVNGCTKPDMIRIYEYTKKSEPVVIREYAV